MLLKSIPGEMEISEVRSHFNVLISERSQYKVDDVISDLQGPLSRVLGKDDIEKAYGDNFRESYVNGSIGSLGILYNSNGAGFSIDERVEPIYRSVLDVIAGYLDSGEWNDDCKERIRAASDSLVDYSRRWGLRAKIEYLDTTWV